MKLKSRSSPFSSSLSSIPSKWHTSLLSDLFSFLPIYVISFSNPFLTFKMWISFLSFIKYANSSESLENLINADLQFLKTWESLVIIVPSSTFLRYNVLCDSSFLKCLSFSHPCIHPSISWLVVFLSKFFGSFMFNTDKKNVGSLVYICESRV